jgi:hypothetical protein
MPNSDELETCRTTPPLLGPRRRRVFPVFDFVCLSAGTSRIDDRRARASGALYSRWRAFPPDNESEGALNGLDGPIPERVRFGNSLDVERRNVEALLDPDIGLFGIDCIGKDK